MTHGMPALLEALTVNAWFAALPQDLRVRMVAGSIRLHLQSGETLLRRGGTPDAWYGVLRGVVRVSILGKDGRS
ncbi:cyclic nucleotide-binding domain-containing protein [Tahibacter caeni]|uniref:cyclic nucleotide-binding domain-containing protein n=1 Tax=Tahibacter caeni TaxID=1453545 RepID=UPI002147DF16|nr:cyclic nucleotide-binding domain-containing protein [Tahibacter caeni]